MLYSSTPLSWQEISIAIQAAGEGNVEKEGSRLSGTMWDGERAIFLYGDWIAPEPEQFWMEEFRRLKHLPEIEAKLGARPRASLLIEIGKKYGSGLLAVELAYQCAIRWSCVVLANTWIPAEGDQFSVVYAREDIERLRAENKIFTSSIPIVWNDEDTPGGNL